MNLLKDVGAWISILVLVISFALTFEGSKIAFVVFVSLWIDHFCFKIISNLFYEGEDKA